MMTSAAAGSAEPTERGALTAAACMFRSLGDPTRLAILQHLAMGEHRVVDLIAHLGLAQSTVTAHEIATLADATIHVSPAAAPGLNPHAEVAPRTTTSQVAANS